MKTEPTRHGARVAAAGEEEEEKVDDEEQGEQSQEEEEEEEEEKVEEERQTNSTTAVKNKSLRRMSVTAGNWLSQHGGRSSTGRETVLPRRQKPYPPCVLSSPRW